MTIQKTPHTQTQQDTKPEQSDLEAGEQEYEADSTSDQKLYEDMAGAETGMNRNSRDIETRHERHRTEPEAEAHEGELTTRISKRAVQGISSHSAEQEGERQRKVVNERPDAQAGVNHSRRK